MLSGRPNKAGAGEGALVPQTTELRPQPSRHIRRNTGPSVRPEAAIQRSKARSGHSSVLPWAGHRHDVGLAPLRLGKAEAQPALGVFESLDPDAHQLGTAQRAGKPNEQERTVALGQGGRHPSAAAAGAGPGPLPPSFAGMLILAGCGALDAGERLGDTGIFGRHRAAGYPMQMADCDPAEDGGFRGYAAAAFAGQERGHVGAGAG